MIGFTHEAFERRIPAIDQHLEVAQLTLRQIDRLPVARQRANLGGPFFLDQQIHESAAMRRNEVVQTNSRRVLHRL